MAKTNPDMQRLKDLVQRCKEMKKIMKIKGLNPMIGLLVSGDTLPYLLTIEVSEGHPFDHLSEQKESDKQKLLKLSYDDMKSRLDDIKLMTGFFPVTIYFVCCSGLLSSCKNCVALKNDTCHLNWKSGGKTLTIIYADWSTPEVLVKDTTQGATRDGMFIIGTDKDIYPPIGNIQQAGIRNFRVTRLDKSVNLKFDPSWKIIIRNEKKEAGYIMKKDGNVRYHVFSFHLSELTNVTATETQTFAFLSNAGINQDDIKQLVNYPSSLPALMRSQSTTGKINIDVIKEEVKRAKTQGGKPMNEEKLTLFEDVGKDEDIPDFKLLPLKRN